MSNLTALFHSAGPWVLDGGLASELERRGHDLSDALWSARLLLDDPQAIGQVHRDYLAAGADCITSAGYQATLPGLQARGLSAGQAAALIQRAVALAVEARDAFWADPTNRIGRARPLVAASIGPYGAWLADGSEYRGDYGLDRAALAAWHRPRWELVAATAADWLACETIPSFVEAQALADLLRETPQRCAWFSFTCRDAARISDGAPLAEAAAWLDEIAQIAAVGINCTHPDLIAPLIGVLRSATSKSIIVYPNAGESWDAARRCWVADSAASIEAFAAQARIWRDAGAALIGGCCRTTPNHIRAIRAILSAA